MSSNGGGADGEFTSARLLICDHYDAQIREFDIYTESLLEKCDNNSSAGNIGGGGGDGLAIPVFDAYEARTDFYGGDKRTIRQKIDGANDEESDDDDDDDADEHDPYKLNNPYTHKYAFGESFDVADGVIEPLKEATSVREFVSKMRMKAIGEIRRVQEDNLQHYESIKGHLEIDREKMNEQKIEDLRRVLFANKFCFVLRIERLKHMEYGVYGNQALFNMFVVVTDFYLSPHDIGLLKHILVESKTSHEEEPNIFFDQNVLLVHLISEYLFQKFSRFIKNQKHHDAIVRLDKNTLLAINMAIFDHQVSVKEVDLAGDRVTLDMSNLKAMASQPYRINMSALKHMEFLSIGDAFVNVHSLTSMHNLRMLALIDCDLETYATPNSLDFLANLPHLESFEISDDWDARQDRVEIRKWKCNGDVLRSLANLRCLKVFYVELVDCVTNSSVDMYKNLLDRLVVLEVKSTTLNQQFIDSLAQETKTATLSKFAFSILANFDDDRFFIFPKNDWFAQWTSLKSLDLSSNNICYLTANHFANLSNLEKLNLSWNNIEYIHETTFKHLTNLRILNLASNPLLNIEDNCLKCIGKLEELNLRETEISSNLNRTWFMGLENLVKLNLSDNFLESIDPNLFIHLPQLEELNLAVNQIRLNERKFEGLHKLKVLNLSFNQLEQIDEATFSALIKLEELNLSSNHLSQLNHKWFDGLATLSNLDFSFNRLFWRNFDTNVLDKLKTIKKINLFGNFSEEPLKNLCLVKKFLDPQGLEVESYYKEVESLF